jgi:hypothetical protein
VKIARYNDIFISDHYKIMFSKSKDSITLVLSDHTKDTPCFKSNGTLYIDSSSIRDDVTDLKGLLLENKSLNMSELNVYSGINVSMLQLT